MGLDSAVDVQTPRGCAYIAQQSHSCTFVFHLLSHSSQSDLRKCHEALLNMHMEMTPWSQGLHVLAFRLCVFILVLSMLTAPLFRRRLRRKRLDLPGPRGWPIIGSARDVPLTDAHLKLTLWAKQYGDIYSFRYWFRQIVVVTDPTLAKELFVSRSKKYSARPSFGVSDFICSRNDVLLLDDTDPRYTQTKAILLRFLRHNSAFQERLMENEASRLMFQFWQNPTEFGMHTRQWSTRIVMRTIWGIRPGEVHDTLYQRYRRMRSRHCSKVKVSLTLLPLAKMG